MTFFRFLLVASVSLLCASQVTAQEATEGSVASELDSMLERVETAEITPIRTESPRNTLQSLYQLRDDLEISLGAYWQQQNTSNAARIAFVMGQIRALIDLSQLPLASRREVGSQTGLSLLDILGRVKPIDAAVLPGPDDLDDQSTAGFRLPGTPLRIVEVAEGDRAGEYLFSADTVHGAPRFLAGLATLPLRSSLAIKSWEDMGRQLAGPWIPTSWIAKLPELSETHASRHSGLENSSRFPVFRRDRRRSARLASNSGRLADRRSGQNCPSQDPESDRHHARSALASIRVLVSGEHRRTVLRSD